MRGVSGTWEGAEATGSDCCEDERAVARPREVRVSRALIGLELALFASAPRVFSLTMRDRRAGVLLLLLLLVEEVVVLLLWFLSLPRGSRFACEAALLLVTRTF